jgi:hypothetical protein
MSQKSHECELKFLLSWKLTNDDKTLLENLSCIMLSAKDVNNWKKQHLKKVFTIDVCIQYNKFLWHSLREPRLMFNFLSLLYWRILSKLHSMAKPSENQFSPRRIKFCILTHQKACDFFISQNNIYFNSLLFTLLRSSLGTSIFFIFSSNWFSWLKA